MSGGDQCYKKNYVKGIESKRLRPLGRESLLSGKDVLWKSKEVRSKPAEAEGKLPLAEETASAKGLKQE